MKANDDKCQKILGFPEDGATIEIENSTIKCSKVKKNDQEYMLTVNSNLPSGKKAHRKLNALSRIKRLHAAS